MKSYFNAVLYARFSSDKQQETSITVQLAECRKFCKAHNINIVGTYVDEARTGTNGEREQFQQMLQDAQLGKFNLVIVHRMDRYARNVELGLSVKRQFEQYGVKLISTVEYFDDTPEGEFFSLMSLGMAALYSKRLSRESFNGQIANAKLGVAHAGAPLYGYEVVKKRYRIVPQEAEAIKTMFDMVASGHTYRETVDYLNAQGYRRRDGRLLSYFITDRLKNRQYTGEYIFNLTKHVKTENGRRSQRKSENEVIRIPNGMPAIIDTETFEKVQKLMSARKTLKGRNKFGKYLLTGLITCGVCGGAVCGTQSSIRGKPYCNYRCGGKDKHEARPQISVVLLDKYIVNLFTSAFLQRKNTERVMEVMRFCLNDVQDRKIQEIHALKAEYDEHRHAVQGLETIILANRGKTLATIVENDLAEEKQKVFELEGVLESLKSERNRLPRLNTETVRKRAQQYKSVLEGVDFRAKQALLGRLIESIVIGEETIETTLNLHEIAGVAVPLRCTVTESKRRAATVYDLLGMSFEFDTLTITA